MSFLFPPARASSSGVLPHLEKLPLYNISFTTFKQRIHEKILARHFLQEKGFNIKSAQQYKDLYKVTPS